MQSRLVILDKYADNGQFSHKILMDATTGIVLWSGEHSLLIDTEPHRQFTENDFKKFPLDEIIGLEYLETFRGVATKIDKMIEITRCYDQYIVHMEPTKDVYVYLGTYGKNDLWEVLQTLFVI